MSLLLLFRSSASAPAVGGGGRGPAFGFGFGSRHRQYLAAPATITPLTIVTAPVISGATGVGSTLTVSSPAVWSGTPASRIYQWYQDATLIVGAINTSYTTVTGDLGHSITVKEQANNGALSTPSQSNAIVVAQAAPTLTKTSGAGVNRMSWSGFYPAAHEWDGVDTGDKVDMQWRVNGGSWNADTRQVFDAAFLLATSDAWPLFAATTFASGAFVEAQERTLRFVAGVVTLTSAWSNIVSDTMA